MVWDISDETRALLEQSKKAYNAHFTKETNFARAIFVSWYCNLGDCSFCYMSVQRNVIKDPKKAKRHPASVFAEIYLCKKLNWDIEFISAGFTGVTTDELLRILHYGSKIYEKKFWLNTGFMPEKLLLQYKPYLEGISGSIETLAPSIHDKVCPSKPIAPYEKLYEYASKHNLQKAITLIVGLGEKKNDFQTTVDFIKKHNIDRITVYALRPVEGTVFKHAPDKDYYLWWLANLRITFPDKVMIFGIWKNDLDSLPYILDAGANLITKYPALKEFGKSWQEKVQTREFVGQFEDVPDISASEMEKDLSMLDEGMRNKTIERAQRYLRLMRKQ